jgi:hypothetical protein
MENVEETMQKEKKTQGRLQQNARNGAEEVGG